MALCHKRYTGTFLLGQRGERVGERRTVLDGAEVSAFTGCEAVAGLVDTVPGIKAFHDIPMPKGRGFFFEKVFPAVWHLRPTRNLRGAYALLEFG